jgi:uncharacterized repeat protein (TIGR03803 family)
MVGLGLASIPALAVQFKVVHQFDGAHGGDPIGGLVFDREGNLYGTAALGGRHDLGVLWRLAGSRFSVLHSFGGKRQQDGADPEGALMMDSDGNILGPTLIGGADGSGANAGVEFKWDTTALAYSVLLSFDGKAGGKDVVAGLVEDEDGMLYGAAQTGGDVDCDCGTVFRIDPATNVLKTIHTFTKDDGTFPSATPVLADGVLHGAATFGGPNDSGSPFTLDVDGTHFASIPATEGQRFEGGQARDATGAFWGTFAWGGTYSAGGIYRIDPAGVYSVAYEFHGGTTEGSWPVGDLLLGKNGMLYGATRVAGAFNCGTVFQFDPAAATLVTLHSFSGSSDGCAPLAGVVQDAAGKLYGVASQDGQFGHGTVFRIKP